MDSNGETTKIDHPPRDLITALGRSVSFYVYGGEMLRPIIAGAIVMLFCSTAFADKTVYDAVVSGKSCSENRQQNISCSFTVGKDLLIEIAGIGSPDAGIAFLRSNIDGDYYAAYGLMHGCVIIKNGHRINKEILDFAFVSPKNGKVYKTWESCQTGM